MNLIDPSKLRESRVAVIGDIMIDEYLTGEVSRISPEAPVPVVRGMETRATPGGAANVAANIAALGARPTLVGVVGAEGREDLARLFGPHGWTVRLDLTTADPSRRTTRKTRISSSRQQIIRLDYEDTHPLSYEVESELIHRALEAIESADIVVISDYGKGVLTDRVLRAVIDRAEAAGKPTVVDPKRVDFSAYRGATYLTPNKLELSRATGLPVETDEQVARAAAKALPVFGGALLVTRSEQGMSFFRSTERPEHIPTVAREVFDVSGAGDTVVAVLGLMLASGCEPLDAIRVANHAAGVVVGKSGTATLNYRELLGALDVESEAQEPHGAQLTGQDAAVVRNLWAAKRLTVGFANGCFDLIHPGHISLIRQAAAACDRLIVALNSDNSVRRLKGPTRPVQNEQARAEVMGAIRGVSAVVVFEDDTPLELIKLLEPDVLVKGADYTLDKVVGADVVMARGGKVVLADLVPKQSTTNLLKAAK